jgi:hypothetical protein
MAAPRGGNVSDHPSHDKGVKEHSTPLGCVTWNGGRSINIQLLTELFVFIPTINTSAGA